MQRIKIISSPDAGDVVTRVNKLLADGWQILSEHSYGIHTVQSNIALVPFYVFYLVKEEKFEEA